MNKPNKLEWNQRDLRLFATWDSLEIEFEETCKRYDESQRRASKLCTPSLSNLGLNIVFGRKRMQKCSEAQEIAAEDGEKRKHLWEQLREIKETLRKELEQKLIRAESASEGDHLAWMRKMKDLVEDLDDYSTRALSALGRSRNTMVHSYNREHRTFPAEVLSLFGEARDRCLSLERKNTAYAELLKTANRDPSAISSAPFPPARDLDLTRHLARIEESPVAVGSRTLHQVCTQIEDYRNQFLEPFQVAHRENDSHWQKRWRRIVDSRLEEERQQAESLRTE